MRIRKTQALVGALLIGGGAVAGWAVPSGRSTIYYRMPDRVLTSIKDPAQRVADAQALVSFYEGRLGAETEDGPKSAIQRKLESLRKSIEAVNQ